MLRGYKLSTVFVWGVYGLLLLVLLDHTIWMFEKFETPSNVSIFGYSPTAVSAALAFELAILVFTHKLAEHLGEMPRYKTAWKRIKYQWLNVYVTGILVSAAVSLVANVAHAWENSQGAYNNPFLFGLFGGILPLASLLFARLISVQNIAEREEDPELAKIRGKLTDVREQLRTTNGLLGEAEKAKQLAEQRFDIIGELAMRIFAPETKKDQILAIHASWPGLSQRAIADMAESSSGYVNDILKEVEVIDIEST